jgi:formamidopyrimidine-DNA glycosylase
MAEDLAKALGSARYQVDFNSISVLSGRYLKFPNTRPVLDYIHGQSRMVRRIYAKGKLLVIECADSAILINPSMTGTVSLAATKHSRLQLWFTVQAGDKGGNVWVHFNDVRNFGTAKVVSLDKLANNLAHVGLGVLDTGLLPFDLDSCLLGLGKRWNNKSICELLLDQSVISGIGNYGKVEALYRAGISPWRKISSLSLFQVVGVYLKAKEVYEEMG